MNIVITYKIIFCIFTEAEERLAQLEKERQALDVELKQAREKIVLSEGKKDFLEAKLYQYAPVLREGK